MSGMSVRSFEVRLIAVACVAALIGSPGCIEPRPKGQRIQSVVLLRSATPWQNLDPVKDEKPEGIQFRMLVYPIEGNKGILVDGTLHVELYIRETAENGHVERTFVDSWTYPMSDLTHTKTPMAIGDFYLVRLGWGNYDLIGREVEFIVSYVDPDGRKVIADPLREIVPDRIP